MRRFNRSRFGGRNWSPRNIGIVVTLMLLLGFGLVDFWKGDSKSYDAEVLGKHTEYTSGSDNSSGSTTYYLEVAGDEDYGIPQDISVWHGKYRKYHTGDKVRVNTASGGITGFTYYTRIK